MTKRSGPVCVDCGDIKRDEYQRRMRCAPCDGLFYSYMHAANRAIRTARRRGVVSAAADHSCVDCGKRAFDWDHRDYTKPLEVQPVCRSCNQRRGPALYPRRVANETAGA